MFLEPTATTICEQFDRFAACHSRETASTDAAETGNSNLGLGANGIVSHVLNDRASGRICVRPAQFVRRGIRKFLKEQRFQPAVPHNVDDGFVFIRLLVIACFHPERPEAHQPSP